MEVKCMSALQKIIWMDWTWDVNTTQPKQQQQQQQQINGTTIWKLPTTFAIIVGALHGFFCSIIAFASAQSGGTLCSSNVLHGSACWTVIASATTSVLWVIAMLLYSSTVRRINEQRSMITSSIITIETQQQDINEFAQIPSSKSKCISLCFYRRIRCVFRQLIPILKICLSLESCIVILISMIGHGLWNDGYVVMAALEAVVFFLLSIAWIPSLIIHNMLRSHTSLWNCCYYCCCCSSWPFCKKLKNRPLSSYSSSTSLTGLDDDHTTTTASDTPVKTTTITTSTGTTVIIPVADNEFEIGE